MDIKKKTYRALFWSFIDRAGEQVLRFIFSIILARLLLPEHFGLIGMAYVLIEIARTFVLGGFGSALINKRDATKIDECSVFYFNIFISCIAVILIYLSAPLMGRFYKSPDLVAIIRLLSLNLLIGSIGTIQAILMTKNIDFKSQTKVSISATLISGSVGIYLAYNNFGVWSLVIQNLFRTVLNTTFMWLVHKWRPRLIFSFHSIRLLFSFGSKLLMGNIVQVVFNNIYTILIGRFFSPAYLGFYSRAQQTLQLPLDTVWFIIGRVTFPVMSTMKDDSRRLRKTLATASNNIAFIVFPCLIWAAILGRGLFLLIFGEKWAPSVVLFQILCISSLFRPLEQVRYSAIISKGKTGVQFTLLLIKYSTTLLSIFITYSYGMKALLIGFCIVSYLNFILNMIYTMRVTGYDLKSQLADMGLPFLCTILSGGVVYFLSVLMPDEALIPVTIQALSGFAVYFLFSYLFKVEALGDNITLLYSLFRRNSSISRPEQVNSTLQSAQVKR